MNHCIFGICAVVDGYGMPVWSPRSLTLVDGAWGLSCACDGLSILNGVGPCFYLFAVDHLLRRPRPGHDLGDACARLDYVLQVCPRLCPCRGRGSYSFCASCGDAHGLGFDFGVASFPVSRNHHAAVSAPSFRPRAPRHRAARSPVPSAAWPRPRPRSRQNYSAQEGGVLEPRPWRPPRPL